MFQLILLTTIFDLFSLNHLTFAKEEAMPTFTISKVFTTRGGVHSTTRGTIRLVFVHKGKWLVFHGGPNMVHFSSDGIHWKGQEISPFGARNHLIRGNTIYSFAHIDTDPDPEKRDMVAATFQGTIRGETIEWGEPHRVPPLTLGYYEDLQQDSTGRFTVSGRVMHFDDAGKVAGLTIEWARSLHPDDITAWGPQQQVIHHVSDMKSSEVHENIPLEEGKSYVLGMLSVNGQGRLYGNLFDGEKWGEEEVLLAENMSTVRGTDKRMSAVWDPKAKGIHLSYVDHNSQLWMRTCRSPYRPQDWSEPIKLKPFEVFTHVMSLDTTRTPSHLWLLYGKTLFEHPDPRWQSGELYLMEYDGITWGESVLVSEPGTKYNWYPNMNEEVSKGIGVLYLKGMPESQAAVEQTDYDIMFASTGTPQGVEETSPSSEMIIREIESAVDHNHCTTRQFQHKTFCHEGVWFVFYSDGKHCWVQTSDDWGKTWQRAKEPVDQAPNGSSSFDVLKIDDTIYVSHACYPLGRYDVSAPYAKDPARRGEYRHEGRIKKGRIEGRTIRWLLDVDPGFTPDYSNIVQDTAGRFWVFTRESGQGVAYGSCEPNDIREWMPKAVCIPVNGRHALDAAALDAGKLYAVSMLTPDGKLYGNLYDGQEWERESILIADEVTCVAGDDRRLSLEFDSIQKRLHLLYVDANNKLRYRLLDAPYRPEDWQPGLSSPGLELAAGVFTCALSVETSQTPYGLMVTYGLEKHVGADKRERMGALVARRFDGKEWQGKAVLITQPGTIHNWYPNVNQDVGDGLCVMYSRSVDKTNLGKPLAVMVSVGIPPKGVGVNSADE